jgi:hypothetical protein
VDEQSFENDVDVVCLPEHTLEPRAAATLSRDDGEIAAARVSETLSIENERNTRLEVRLADDELAALRDLDDGAFGR